MAGFDPGKRQGVYNGRFVFFAGNEGDEKKG